MVECLHFSYADMDISENTRPQLGHDLWQAVSDINIRNFASKNLYLYSQPFKHWINNAEVHVPQIAFNKAKFVKKFKN